MTIRKSQKEDSGENKDRLLSKDYVLVMLGATGQAFMNNFFIAVMPLYIAKRGGTTFQAGMIMTVFALVALLVRPVSGILSDKFGRVKLMVGGAAVCSVTCAIFGVVGVVPLLMVIRGINGAGFGVLSTCSGAAVADIVPKSRLSEGIGIFGLYATIAQAIGPFIALEIVFNDELSEYRLLFFITAGICALSALANGCISYERKRKKQGVGTGDVSDGKNNVIPDSADGEPLPKTFLGFEHNILPAAAVIMVMFFGLAGLMSYMTPFARWKGVENPGLYFTVSACGVFISRMIFGRVVDRRGADIVVIPGMIVIIICLALLPQVESLTALVALALPLGMSQGAVTPTFNSMLFQRCSPARRGTASGAYFAAIDIGFAVGSPILGALADAWDYGYIFSASAIFVGIALVLYLLIASDKRYKAKIRT